MEGGQVAEGAEEGLEEAAESVASFVLIRQSSFVHWNVKVVLDQRDHTMQDTVITILKCL